MEHRQALKEGTKLLEYEILSVLGSGGFGIVYLAKDSSLNENVVVKEYLPNEFAIREIDQTVIAKSANEETDFEWGLKRFLEEARALASLRKHPNIVSVLRFFRENKTGYIVMEPAGQQSLKDYLENHNVLTQQQIEVLLWPLLDALKLVHANDILHRDLKPGNILINNEGDPVIIDFGAARHAMGGKSISLTAIVSGGYSPFEQYTSKGKQGPWTDIYSLAAVMYRCVTGKKVFDATDRMALDELPSAVDLCAEGNNYDINFLEAIDWGLKINASERPQSIEEWEQKIYGTEEPNKSTVKISQPSNLTGTLSKDINRPKKDKTKLVAFLAISFALATSLGIYLYLNKGDVVNLAAKTNYQKDIPQIVEKPKPIEEKVDSIIEKKPQENLIIPEDIKKNMPTEIHLRSTVQAIQTIRSQENKLGIAMEQLKTDQELVKITGSQSRKKIYRESVLNTKKMIADYKQKQEMSIDDYVSNIKLLCNFGGGSSREVAESMKKQDPKISDYLDIVFIHKNKYCSKTTMSSDEVMSDLMSNFN